MAQVFISHCANHDPQSEIVLNHLVTELGKAFTPEDIELVWDREVLGVGDDWEDRLLDVMDECDGAILLLSATALKRPYVVKECTLLAQRKRHSEKWPGYAFELLSLFVGGVTADDLLDPEKSDMTELSLDRYQAGNDGDLPALVAALTDRLNRLLVTWKRGIPSQSLLRDIAGEIVDGKTNTDRKLTEQLDIQLPKWTWRDASPTVRAVAVARELPEKGMRRVGFALVEAKRELDRDAAEAIVERLAPFRVPSKAAASIPEVANDHNSARAIEINAMSFDTGRWYVRLAYGQMLESFTAEVTNADAGLGNDLLENEIIEKVLSTLSFDTVDEVNRMLKESKKPFFVFVPAARPNSEVSAGVYKQLPTVTLLFLTGQKRSPAPTEPRGNVTLLEPLLAENQEDKAEKDYNNTLQDVWRAHGGKQRRHQ